MEGFLHENPPEEANGQHVGKMLLGSLAIHLAIFSLVFLIPGYLPAKRFSGTVYEVNLVEAVPKTVPKGGGRAVSKQGKTVARPQKAKPAKRVGKLVSKEKAVVIAKRVVKKKPATRIKPQRSPKRTLDEAISKIERKVKTSEKQTVDTVQQAISRIESKVKEAAPPSGSSGGTQTGIAMQLYKLEVETRIKENWGYPAAFIDPEKNKDLEALVIVKVSRDGTILKSWFEKTSGNAGYDESVRKAIERSNPLPPFPEGYLKTYEEIELHFNLKELEEG